MATAIRARVIVTCRTNQRQSWINVELFRKLYWHSVNGIKALMDLITFNILSEYPLRLYWIVTIGTTRFDHHMTRRYSQPYAFIRSFILPADHEKGLRPANKPWYHGQNFFAHHDFSNPFFLSLRKTDFYRHEIAFLIFFPRSAVWYYKIKLWITLFLGLKFYLYFFYFGVYFPPNCMSNVN
jgi:hypothetical protein